MTQPLVTTQQPIFQVLDNGLEISDGVLQYAWFRLLTSAGEKYRCVSFMELASVPYDLREDPEVLGKQWALLRGVYNAGVDFVYAALGIYTPDPIGIVQLYGAAGEGETLQSASQKAMIGVEAVRAGLANFPQAQTKPPNLRWIEWYLDFVVNSKNILVLLGHPDPRASKRGLGWDQQPEYTKDDLTGEQNEILFRGLAKLRKDFLFQVAAHHVPRDVLAKGVIRVAEVASNIASRRRGAINIGFSLGIPILAALGQSLSGLRSHGDSHAQSASDSVSEAHGTAHTDSHSRGVSETYTTGGSETHTKSVAYSTSTADSTNWGRGESWAHTDSQSHTDSGAHTESHSVTDSTSISKSSGVGSSWSVGGGSSWSTSGSEMTSGGVGHTTSTNVGHTDSVGSGVSLGTNESTSHSFNRGINMGGDFGTNASLGMPGVGSLGGKLGVSGGWNAGQTDGHSQGSNVSVSHNTGSSNSVGVGNANTVNSGWSKGSSWAKGGSSSWSSGGSSFSSTTKTTGHAETRGTADTVGWADTKGSADTIGGSKSWGGAHTQGQTFTQGESWSETKSWAHSKGTSEAWGTADTQSYQSGRAHTDGVADAVTTARGLASGLSMGFSTGLVPGVNFSRSWQTEDDVADTLTDVLRDFEALAKTAVEEGGFMTDAIILTKDDNAAAAAEVLVPQAFHGTNTPTSVLTIRPRPEDDQIIRAAVFTTSPVPLMADNDPFNGLLWTRYSTLLTCGLLSSYPSPAIVEEGTAVVTIAPTPKGLTYYPIMPGDVVLGHQFSPMTRDLTTAQVRLSTDRLFHTMFASDTGFGKTVGAMRMAYETTLRWHTRTVILDFSVGWRALLNAPGLEGHIDIRQLYPSAPRPLRWNPLQIGRNINPEVQWRAFVDIFSGIGQLGVRRQKHELMDALHEVYVRAGVLVDDPEVREDPLWSKIANPEEANRVGLPVGTPLSELSNDDRQAIAVLRSTTIGLKDLYQNIREKLNRVPGRDTMLTGVLEGILKRLNDIIQGSASAQYAPGQDTVPMEDLAQPWGIVVIEGGNFLDEFGKAFLLGWISWHLYTDMVVRRIRNPYNNDPILQIIFEEANKIFGGIDRAGNSEEGTSGLSLSQRFGDMFRDARKYKAFLHVITQSPSLIPQDIISSCNNLVVGLLKNPKDKDIVLAAIARSEKGFVDEPWRRFLSDLQIGMFIGRFPYTTQREYQQPFLFQPLPLRVPEPTDAEIEQKLGRILL
ncbi:MAG: serine-rich protein [Anaerolineales bacterium]